MNCFDYTDIEFLLIAGAIYLFIAATVAKIGSYRVCGGTKAFITSIILTPFIGIIYALVSPQKHLIKTVHYRCTNCGLEYVSKYKYCPSCAKEGKYCRLEKVSMKTY
ncbi:MAG: hypothetical protein K8R37_12910 [Bacteroidales bacterium]|nr:hypothetical protein [Bacteroidales bacterium]